MSKSNAQQGMVVVGTDTGVGKTRVTCWMAQVLTEQGLRVGVCKPAVSGGRTVNGTSGSNSQWIWDDLTELREICSVDAPDEWICPNRWIAPLSPPMAQREDAKAGTRGFPGWHSSLPSIADYGQILNIWKNRCDFLLVEGIGGLLCPLTETETFAELAAELSLPLVVVARLGLGTLNHTLLTLKVAMDYGLDVRCVVLNRPTSEPDGIAEQTNALALRERLRVPILGPLPFQATSNPIPDAIRCFDWRGAALGIRA